MKNNDIKILESLISKYGKSSVNLAVNRLNEARVKAPSKWTKIKKNSRNIKNSYRGGDIYDRYSGSYYQNDTYTDITYEGYIMDKNGNEYRVNGESIHGDSGSIAGGGRDYYINIFLDDNVIKLTSYSGIMSRSTGSAIINSIGDGYYLEDYLAIYKNDIDYESRKIAAPLIQNGTADVKSNETNKEERKKQLLLSKKEKFFKTYEKLNSISADIDEYGEWSNIKINSSNIEKIDSIENLLDKKFNDLFNTSKYNYAGIEFILEFGSNSVFNKYTYDIISYDNETYKIDTNKIGYNHICININADKINKDLKRALINKWKESSRWSMHKNNQYKELINLVKTSSKPIRFNDKGKSYYNYAYPIDALIVDFERKLSKNKKITKDDSVHNEPISTDASLNKYPKIAYDKMLAWHEGTRKQNVGAMGDEKLKMNYNICKAMGYNKEANILKAEADERGLLLENMQFNHSDDPSMYDAFGEVIYPGDYVIVVAHNDKYPEGKMLKGTFVKLAANSRLVGVIEIEEYDQKMYKFPKYIKEPQICIAKYK